MENALEIQVSQGDITHVQADAVVVNLFEGVTSPGGGTGSVDKALNGLISDELAHNSRFKGKLGETLVLHTHGKIPARYVVVVGLGRSEDLDAKALRRASAATVKACKKLPVVHVATILHGAGIGGRDAEESARLLSEGAMLGNYAFTLRKSDKDDKKDAEKPKELARLTIVEADAGKLDAIQQGVALGRVIGNAVNTARTYVADSPNNVTPTFLKEAAENIPGLICNVLDFNLIKSLGMGAFTLVAQGSDEPPFLIHLSYKPTGTAKKKVALVGKGITFDSGGLSLKPPKSQETMKMDMAGAAAVLCAMQAIAELSNTRPLDIQVDAFIPTCENMPGGRSSKPGDIVTTMNGMTVEVNNTDAEGRLILCDALTYAQQQTDPDELIDLATLTGACIIALGNIAAGVMGTDDTLIEELTRSGALAGEKFWRLPLYDEYKKFLKSEFADLINAGNNGEAGSQAGGMFLKEFVDENRKWAHLDIAGPAWGSEEFPEVPKGPTGFGVRTLLYYLYHLG